MTTMSPARESLVAAGVRLLERDGLAALSVRNVAAEAGTSTTSPSMCSCGSPRR
jgi:AcrR family transcriptional regulator